MTEPESKSKLSRDEKMKMLAEDLERSIRTCDTELHERTRAEFYDLSAQKAKAEGDKITLYLLAAIEECNKEKMMGVSSLLNALILFHKVGQLDKFCGFYLSPLAVELSLEIVNIAKSSRVE